MIEAYLMCDKSDEKKISILCQKKGIHICKYIGETNLHFFKEHFIKDSILIYSGDIDFDVLFQYLKEKEYPYTLSLEPEVAFEEAILCMKRLKEKA